MGKKAKVATPAKRATGRTKTVRKTAAPPVMRITDDAILNTLRRTRTRVIYPDPFTLPQFPPSALPPSAEQMAMDQGVSSSVGWASASDTLASLRGMFDEGLGFLGFSYLSQLAQRGEYRRMAETLATEATRKWIELTSSSDDEGDDKEDRIKELGQFLDDIKLRACAADMIEKDSYFGRSHLFLSTGPVDDQELTTPLGSGVDRMSRSKIRKGKGLVSLQPVEAMWTYPLNYNSNDPLSPDWYCPAMWSVNGRPVHKTRLLRFVAREVPDLLKPTYAFGGLSLTQIAKPYVDNWLNIRQNVADITQAFSTFVLSTQMAAWLQDGGENLRKRAEVFNNIRNNSGMMIVDKTTEEFSNVSAPLTGLEALQAQSQEHMAAISGIPIVKLLGIQPAGLNASSEGEIRVFYDWVLAYQEKFLRPNLTAIINFAMLTLWGEVDPDIKFRFIPLMELDEKAKAEVRKTEAETGQILINGGVIDPREERKRVATDPDTPYMSLDVDALPEPPDDGDPDDEGAGTPDDSDEDAETPPPGEDEASELPEDLRDDQDMQFLSDYYAADEAKWEEGKHPRRTDGKFGTGGSSGGASTSEKPKQQSQKFHEIPVGKKVHYFQKTPTWGTEKEQKHLTDLLAEISSSNHPNKGALHAAMTEKLAESKKVQQEKAQAKIAKKGSPKAKPKPSSAAAPSQPEPAELAASPYKASSYEDYVKKFQFAVSEEAQEEVIKQNPGFAAQHEYSTAMVQAASTPVKTEPVHEPQPSFDPDDLPPEAYGKDPDSAKWAKEWLQPGKEVQGGFGAGKLSALIAKLKSDGAVDPAVVEQLTGKLNQYNDKLAKKEQASVPSDPVDAQKFNNLVMVSDPSNAKAAVNHATSALEKAPKDIKDSGITVYEAASITHYSNGGYRSLNKALRAGVMTEAQYNATKDLNEALSKLPPYQGTTRRGTSMPSSEFAKYKPGMVVEERGFTSTSTVKGFSGEHVFEVHGKTGRLIESLSYHTQEKEVLFRAGSRFKVVSNDGKTVVLEEMV